ncbi:YHS domain-containing (seleno)protein [Candidatus Spongiihabitans sp.]|uniref:YHS domain-containing (seleno)protein n=1 Tax=Candidatus Spongiihabitans sp. TaxID=3101308 RepID=UPI003C702115
MKNYLRNLTYLFMLAAMTLPGPAWSGEDPIYTTYFSSVAAGGYDVTSYFSEAQPIKGEKAFKMEYMDADWYFANQENLDKFIQNPQRYAPQYGGYCAWAVSQGSTASGDPLLWTIHEDKLYLNYNHEINHRWSSDKERLIVEADKNWPTVLN